MSTVPPVPTPEDRPTVHADYWLAIAAEEYETRHWESASAAAQLAAAWCQRGQLEPTTINVEDAYTALGVDYLGERGPTGRDVRNAQAAAGVFS